MNRKSRMDKLCIREARRVDPNAISEVEYRVKHGETYDEIIEDMSRAASQILCGCGEIIDGTEIICKECLKEIK